MTPPPLPLLSSLPKFMPPVTLTSPAPHPYLPFQPSKSQFIIAPSPVQETLVGQHTVSQTLPALSKTGDGDMATPKPKNILAAAKAGNLEWVERYSAAGQTEIADNMGEVRYFALLDYPVQHTANSLYDRLPF